MARLIAICIFKQVLPIAAVQALFNIQRLSYDAPTAFDYVVDQLEASIRAAFSVEQTPVPDTAHQVTRESLLVRSAVSSFVSKAYLMSYLKFNGFNSSPTYKTGGTKSHLSLCPARIFAWLDFICPKLRPCRSR